MTGLLQLVKEMHSRSKEDDDVMSNVTKDRVDPSIQL